MSVLCIYMYIHIYTYAVLCIYIYIYIFSINTYIHHGYIYICMLSVCILCIYIYIHIQWYICTHQWYIYTHPIIWMLYTPWIYIYSCTLSVLIIARRPMRKEVAIYSVPFVIGRGALINTDSMHIHIYTHVCIYMYTYIHVYICIYIGRHRWWPLSDRARLIDQHRQHAYTHMHTRTHIHVHIHIYWQT